ncbi:MAG TPA: O-antigen ligase family protein, partial [Saprospiraceae bacterium]|nr:O-antigen ligase family protein [Saprospiraceae bacterium]
FGFGPGNFYFNYKSYTVSSFQTYVSRNPEKSGIHSYYLMTLVEQGIVGLSVFMLLIFYALAKAEVVYHSLKDRESRFFLLSGVMSFVVILSLLLINDMVETDKVGPFFFLSLVIITNMDLKVQEEKSSAKSESE